MQFQKDKEAFDRRASLYRKRASEPYHHHKPQGSILTLWETGHIVDRGRTKGQGVVYDPINHGYRVPPPEGTPPKESMPRPLRQV